jgi:hypothetical protein
MRKNLKKHSSTEQATPLEATATKVGGVTWQTFGDKANAYGAMNAILPRTIFRERQQWNTQYGKDFRNATPREWGAWRDYLSTLPMVDPETGHRLYYRGTREPVRPPMGFFDSRKFYTVPAQWPHMFDEKRDAAADMAAADRFVQRAQREEDGPQTPMFDTARLGKNLERRAFAMRMKQIGQTFTPAVERRPRTTLIDETALFQEYDKAMAERDARRKTSNARAKGL